MKSTEKEARSRSFALLIIVAATSLVAFRFGEVCEQNDHRQIRINELLSHGMTAEQSSADSEDITVFSALPLHGPPSTLAGSSVRYDPLVRATTGAMPIVPQAESTYLQSVDRSTEIRPDARYTPPSTETLAPSRSVARGVSDQSPPKFDARRTIDHDWEDLEEIMPIELADDAPVQREQLPPVRVPRRSDRNDVPKLSKVAPLHTLKNLVTSTQLTSSPNAIYWSLDDAINAALHFSFRIDALRVQAFESYQEIGIEYGNFDTAFFLEQRLGETNQPVGNSFEVDGTAGRIRGQESSLRWGLRKELLAGGSLQVDDNTELRDDNSGVLNPPDQARSGLNFEFSQPLLRGSGKSIAMNQVLVAAHNASAQKVRSTAEIADLVNSVSNAYWDLYTARGQIIATLESIELSKGTVVDLEARESFDADLNIVEQARRTVQRLKIALRERTGALRDAQIELARLVNAPELMGNIADFEIIPIEDVPEEFNAFDLPSLIATGVGNRPEIQEALERIKAAALENHLGINELLPELNFILNASFDGLAGDRDIPAAAVSRFDSNGTYSVGFDVNVPLANRAARFRQRRTELALTRLNRDFQDVVEGVKQDVRSAANTMSVNDQQWSQQRKVLESLVASLNNLEARQYRAPREGADSAFQLTQILNAQSEISESKSAFIEALANRQKAVIDLNRATGMLVNQVDAGLPHSMERNRPISIYRNFRSSDEFYRPQTVGVKKEVRVASRPMRRQPSKGKFSYPQQHFYSEPVVSYSELEQAPLQPAAQEYRDQRVSVDPNFSNYPAAANQHVPEQLYRRRSHNRAASAPGAIAGPENRSLLRLTQPIYGWD